MAPGGRGRGSDGGSGAAAADASDGGIMPAAGEERRDPRAGVEGSSSAKSEVTGGRGGSGSSGGAGAPPEAESGGGVAVERTGEHSAVCRWSLSSFSRIKARALWSRYFEVGGYDCRLLVYPKGDAQALPGYMSIYLQVTDPRGSSAKWDCFASYHLCVTNQRDDSKSIKRDSWHRFSGKKKSHGWCDFTPSAAVLDPKAGFYASDTVVITAEILVLHETHHRSCYILWLL